jgi:hypothetical protein
VEFQSSGENNRFFVQTDLLAIVEFMKTGSDELIPGVRVDGCIITPAKRDGINGFEILLLLPRDEIPANELFE